MVTGSMLPVRALPRLVVLTVALALSGCSTGGSGGGTTGGTTGTAAAAVTGQPSASQSTTGPVRLAATRAGVALPAPLRDMVVFADGTGLLVAGGLTPADTSTASVVRVDLAGRRAGAVGRLAAPVHDAAGCTVNGAHLVFGGGTTQSSPLVQVARPSGSGRVVGSLPQPRSDLAAVCLGGYGYLLGGYTGKAMLPEVLRTVDGRSFQAVASLAVPVRYPALAASGGNLWVMGGLTASDKPTDAVQRVDLGSGTSQIVGHLPEPLSHAAGFTLGSGVYLAGGQDARGRRLAGLSLIGPDGTATPAGTLPTPVSDAGVATLGAAAFLVGGQTPATSAAIIEIQPAAG